MSDKKEFVEKTLKFSELKEKSANKEKIGDLLNALESMTWMFSADITSARKNQYSNAIEGLRSGNQHIFFNDCELTTAHLLIITEILKLSNKGEYLGLDLGGRQAFSADEGAKLIIEMLQTNPKPCYTMHLPSFLANNEKIQKIWSAAARDEQTRILSFDKDPPSGMKLS